MRLEEKAARTVFTSFLLFIKVFDLAGEVQVEKCVSGHPALEGAVLAYERKRRQLAKSAGGRRGKSQATQMLLVVPVALDYEVREKKQLLFAWAYAWYRLLRHWSSWRYSDT